MRLSCSGADRAGPLLLAAAQFRFGGGQVAQTILPFGFQAARDEPVLRLHRPVTALGSFGLIAQRVPLPNATATSAASWLAWSCWTESHTASTAAGVTASRKALATACSIAIPPTLRQYTPRPSTMSLPAQ